MLGLVPADGGRDGLGDRARIDDLHAGKVEPVDLAGREDAEAVLGAELIPDPDEGEAPRLAEAGPERAFEPEGRNVGQRTTSSLSSPAPLKASVR